MIIELFKTITSIPRCSGNHQPFIGFINQFAQKYNYICKVDKANNILCYKQNSKSNICLQSHYDIVCLEENTIPTIIEEDGYLKAKNSTLGADNGIGCAYMLDLMTKDSDCEFLFTCDEEIGLIGANNINLNIQSKYMLNLDSEQEGEICIGCAGGIDIFATNNNSKLTPNSSDKTLYEITISNLDGGHSGVDIDKNIPNGIKLLVNIIKDCDGDILDINGGERINSIPKSAKAIIATNVKPKSSNPNITINKIDTPTKHYKKLDSNILKFLNEFKNGVLEYDDNLDVVISSINLSIISTNIDDVKIELSARSMDNDKLKIITQNTIDTLEDLGFTVITNGKYPAWKPDINEFTNDILQIYKQTVPNVALKAIHAGLECAIFKEKFPDIKIASIGPNIYFPHSFNEKVEIKSIYNISNIIKKVIKRY